MKIKVFTENVKVSIEDDFALARDYFKKQANIDVTFEVVPIKLKKRNLTLNPNVNAYSVEGFNDELKPFITDEYMAIYAFNADEFNAPTTSAMIGWVKPYVSLISLKTASTDDSVGWIWKSIVHEMIHGFFQKAYFAGFRGMVDQMDKTLVNGKWLDYYKNDDPYALDGNHAVSLKELEPYLATLRTEPKPASKKWKYFTEKEVKGLKPELVDMLDKARELASVAFKIESGLRSKEKNAQVGGVPNSAHLEGIAVDLVCKTSVDRNRILKALLQVGFNRVGIGDTFLHADISKTLPQDVIWLYD